MSDTKKLISRHCILQLIPVSTATNTIGDVFLSFRFFFPLPSSHCLCHYCMVGPFSLGYSYPLTPLPALNNKPRLRGTAFYNIQEYMCNDELCSIRLCVTGETQADSVSSFLIPCGYRYGCWIRIQTLNPALPCTTKSFNFVMPQLVPFVPWE